MYTMRIIATHCIHTPFKTEFRKCYSRDCELCSDSIERRLASPYQAFVRANGNYIPFPEKTMVNSGDKGGLRESFVNFEHRLRFPIPISKRTVWLPTADRNEKHKLTSKKSRLLDAQGFETFPCQKSECPSTFYGHGGKAKLRFHQLIAHSELAAAGQLDINAEEGRSSESEEDEDADHENVTAADENALVESYSHEWPPRQPPPRYESQWPFLWPPYYWCWTKPTTPTTSTLQHPKFWQRR